MTSTRVNRFASMQRTLDKLEDPEMTDSDEDSSSTDEETEESTTATESSISTEKPTISNYKETESVYDSRCAAHKCSADHVHKWKQPDAAYSNGPHTCVKCRERFNEMTTKTWKYPECKSCREIPKPHYAASWKHKSPHRSINSRYNNRSGNKVYK